MAKPLSPAEFRKEAERRLIDTYTLANELGLRSRESVRERALTGVIPPPVYTKESVVSLWDRDDLELPDTKEATG